MSRSHLGKPLTPGRPSLGATPKHLLLCSNLTLQPLLYPTSLLSALKVESLQLKINVVASYVAAELSGEVPGLMSAMQVGGVTGRLQGTGFYGWCTGAMLLV